MAAISRQQHHAALWRATCLLAVKMRNLGCLVACLAPASLSHLPTRAVYG